MLKESILECFSLHLEILVSSTTLVWNHLFKLKSNRTLNKLATREMKTTNVIHQNWQCLTECGFRVSFDCTPEWLEQYDRKGRVLLQMVSGVSGLNSYTNNVTHSNTNLFHFLDQYYVYHKILSIICTCTSYTGQLQALMWTQHWSSRYNTHPYTPVGHYSLCAVISRAKLLWWRQSWLMVMTAAVYPIKCNSSLYLSPSDYY